MKTSTEQVAANKDIALFVGKLASFNSSLKLYHWHVTGAGSYSQHIALDQALESLPGILDRVVETSYSLCGDMQIVIPQTCLPANLIKEVEDFYVYVRSQRDLFPELLTQSIIDDYQETVQQLLYRLKRLQ